MSADPDPSGAASGAASGPEPGPPAHARRDAWSGYWQAGLGHSCPGSFGDAYGGAIGLFWQSVLEHVGPEQRVLDVGTGNGPVPRLMAEHLGDACPSIDAVDVAAIRPGWWTAAAYPRVRFHAGVGAEDLPFESAGFDWLVSQYGFEYGDRVRSLSECRRVLRPGGRVAMVLHHRESVVCQVARAELVHHRYLLSGDGLFAAAERVIPYVHQAASRGAAALAGDEAARSAREGYNAAIVALGERITGMSHAEVLVEARQGVHALVSGAASRPVPLTLQALRSAAGEFQAAATRLDDLLEHALDERQVTGVAHALASTGGAEAVSCEPLRQEEGILGWALRIGIG